jgi:Ca2+/Na+ antiporter
MSFRTLNQKYFEPGSQILMIFGIIALCQPWNEFLHRYGLTITLIGLVAFSIATKIAPEAIEDEDNTQ